MMIYVFIQPVQLLLQKYFWVSTIIVNAKPHIERYILKNQRSDGCCTEIWFAIMYK